MKTLLLCAALLYVPGLALATDPPYIPPPAAPAAPSSAAMSEGEVRKIDLATARLTLRHGEIKSLDMPPMTMVFEARDKRLLDGLKVGDRLRFAAARVGGQLVVTAIEAAR